MDSLRQVFEALIDQFQDHAAKILTGLVLMAVGWLVGWRRARSAWRKREFLDRLNVSLNLLDNGQLKIRTLSEKRCEEVFLNQSAAENATKYARQTTTMDPILPIPKDDCWHYLNPVLNELSEQFAAGSLKRDLGAPVNSAIYLVCLTCECAGELRTRKIRAMVVRKDALLKLSETVPQLQEPAHATRWQTLQAMAKSYQTQPWRFIEMELAI